MLKIPRYGIGMLTLQEWGRLLSQHSSGLCQCPLMDLRVYACPLQRMGGITVNGSCFLNLDQFKLLPIL